MEWIIRFGADKRKAKLIDELRNQIKELETELQKIKIDNVFQQNEIRKLKRKNNYLEKKDKHNEKKENK